MPRTATVALSNILLPYVEALARLGPAVALRTHAALGRGYYTHDGRCLKPLLTASIGLRHEVRRHEIAR